MGKILIVDDQDALRRPLRRMLEKAGFEVTEADGGRKALLALETDHYDLVLLDLHMPDLDGLEVTRRLRETGKPLPAIIAMSGDTEFPILEMAKGLGAVVTLPKPFELHQLLATVKDVLAKAPGDSRSA